MHPQQLRADGQFCHLSCGLSTTSTGGGAYGCTLNNCTLTGNSAHHGGGSYGGTLNNCILVGNSAYYIISGESPDEGVGGGSFGDTLNNCIVYYNSASTGPFSNVPIGPNFWGSSLNYCCTPDPGGVGNITCEPRFVDLANGNLRLQSNSPCINAGNNTYVIGSTDLDGNPRIFGGTVDMGAYEFQEPATLDFSPGFSNTAWPPTARRIIRTRMAIN